MALNYAILQFNNLAYDHYMNKLKHMLVLGGSGLVGYNVAKYFSNKVDWKVTTASRRTPENLINARTISVDLSNETSCSNVFSQLQDVSHIVYAAYFEKAGTKGWNEPEQMEINKKMFQNVIAPMLKVNKCLQHITLIQGTKAYGDPLSVIPIPAKEKSPRATHDIFYWLQEDWLKSQQIGKSWSWTILRPQIIFGESLGSHMNIIPAIGAYAAILKSEKKPLYFPGGPSWVREAVDAELLAKACEWAGSSPSCVNETFNITNGDVFEWRNIWPSIADALGMLPGPDKPLSLNYEMSNYQEKWRRVVRFNNLSSPEDLESFVGQGFAYADRQFCYGMAEAPPVRLVSTIKAREAGFNDCIDTELMFRKCFKNYQDLNWIPKKNVP
jgi:nucleoside-diphosphate-sugar epimerase